MDGWMDKKKGKKLMDAGQKKMKKIDGMVIWMVGWIEKYGWLDG